MENLNTVDDSISLDELEQDDSVSLDELSSQSQVVPWGVPGRFKVQEQILGRKDSVSTLLDEIEFQKTRKYRNFLSEGFGKDLGATAFDILSAKPFRTAFVTGLKTVAIPFQRVEAGIANTALEVQAANFEVKNLLDNFVDGVSGKKSGQIGDIIRSTEFGGTFNEPLAATIGLVSMAGFDKLATKGTILNATNKFVSAIPNRLPKSMGKNFLLQRAEIAKNGIDELQSSLGKEVDTVFEKVGDKLVKDPQAVNDAMQIIPPRIRTVIEKDVRHDLGIKSGPIPTTLNNVRRLRQRMDEYLNLDNPDLDQQLLNKGANLVRRAINSTDQEVSKVNEAFHQFKELADRVRRILVDKSSGKVKDTGLRNLYKKDGERGIQIDVENLLSRKDISQAAQKVVREVLQYNRRQTLKKIGWGVGATGIGLVALEQFLRKPLRQAAENVTGIDGA